MQQLPKALEAMARYRQFIVYVLVPSKTKAGKNDKFPIDHRTGRMPEKGHGGAHDPAIWTDFDTAALVAGRCGPAYGVGFVFTRHDPFWFLDIDNCAVVDAAGNRTGWSRLACDLVAALPGAAVEVSSSGRGLHVFGSGAAPVHGCRPAKSGPYADSGLEFYDDERFVALTGTGAVGDIATDLGSLLPSLVHQFFPPGAAVTNPSEWTSEPCEGWRGPVDDAELLKRAMQSRSLRSGFGTAACFADLWERNVDVLRVSYPPDGNGKEAFGESEADRALAQHLAFWTGKNCERMERLMRASGLVREKWDSHGTYMHLTIMSAVAVQGDVLVDKLPEPVGGLATPADPTACAVAQPIHGSTYSGAEEQLAMFKGCSYVLDQHRALIPGGLLLKPDQFRVVFGGYTFLMDAEGKRSVRDPWEVFTQSQMLRFPRADSSCFRPELAPGAIIEYAGQKKSNLWWPVTTERKVGDAGPFLRHLAALLPDERDRMILLSYMAAVVQYKGYKFQWAPLIQGAEGNGKTLLTRCVAFAIGDRYTYFPKASQIAKNFNGWQYGTIFAGIEDIYVAEGNAHVMEELKPMVTGDRNEVESKGVDQIVRELVFNLMLNSNHKDALRKHRNDRRFAMFYTAQQTAEEILEWGMGGDYFPRLYSWLRAEGYAIVNELLHTFVIPAEFNPCVQMGGLAQRAPLTSSYEAAISANLGSVEQEVLEAVEQGLPGFAGGWVSSAAFDALLERMNRSGRVARNKRRDMLVGLGYDWHPGLVAGRVNNIVQPDGCKPHLFIKQGHPARLMVNGADIARAYTAAQAPALINPGAMV